MLPLLHSCILVSSMVCHRHVVAQAKCAVEGQSVRSSMSFVQRACQAGKCDTVLVMTVITTRFSGATRVWFCVYGCAPVLY